MELNAGYYAVPNTPLIVQLLAVFLFCLFINHTVSSCYFIKEVEEEEESKKEKEKETPVIIKYEDKYKEKYETMEEIELTEDRLLSLKNSILLEKTPLGNVLLFYDHSRGTFTYYSDNAIPYRFLETVSRKYVVQNDCKKIYISMEDEIKEAEERKQLESKKLDSEPLPEKKTVFAKLKEYNTGVKKQGPKKTPEKSAIVKEKANRYSYEGKMMNYSFLKKVDRKVVDKVYSTSFSEFKKLYYKGV